MNLLGKVLVESCCYVSFFLFLCTSENVSFFLNNHSGSFWVEHVGLKSHIGNSNGSRPLKGEFIRIARSQSWFQTRFFQCDEYIQYPHHVPNYLTGELQKKDAQLYNYLLGQWLNCKLFGITIFSTVGKKVQTFISGFHWLSETIWVRNLENNCPNPKLPSCSSCLRLQFCWQRIARLQIPVSGGHHPLRSFFVDENRCFGLIDDELMHAEYEATTIHYRL